MKNGETFSGVFFGASLEGNDRGYLLKMVQKTLVSDKGEANGVDETYNDYVGSGEDHAMTFDFKDVVHLAVNGVTFDIRDKALNGWYRLLLPTYQKLIKLGTTAGFRTDADISGSFVPRERNLQRWEPSADAGNDMSLEGTGDAWDQFQTNEQRFGLKSDYDENIYTTMIDKSHPDYRRREAEAQRIAQEIEGGQADNAHIREERGISHPEDTMDEEEK